MCNSDLDNYPTYWIEGVATLMEHTGFASIKDYLQYSYDFVSEPDSSIFNENAPDIFCSCLLTVYQYERIQSAPTIGFAKQMFLNTLTNPNLPFQQNLDSVSSSLGTSWTTLLGNFYTSSYFTGSRSLPD
jgi:hypothetical protein